MFYPLADVFENFRNTCHYIYKLDPAHYTVPGLSLDAMLKYTNITIELFTDIEMLSFLEKGIPGGILPRINTILNTNIDQS